MEYNKTLNLPKTDFPMRANLSKREPEILEFWEKNDIYHAVQKKNAGKPKFVLHDGPPFANGHIHLGTTLNKVLKDIIVKYKSMNGFDAPYVPGWDTHGLPIEQQVIKNLGIDRSKVSAVEFRNKCRDYAWKFINIQRDEFKRLGVRGDWENPYITLLPEYEAIQVEVFGEMAKKGYIYKGLKPVYWCPDCGTALAEAEVEYMDKRSPSIYVRFKVKDAKGKFPEENSYVVIWTTTPWTLPANVAISLHPDFKYVLLETEKGNLLVAKELKDDFVEKVGLEKYEVVKEFEGSELEKIVCENPLLDRESLVILGDHVTLEQGTGCVHTAPGHGLEDYEVGRKYGLPVISPVDDKGKFTEEGLQFAGMTTDEANKAIGKELEEKGDLLKLDFIKHQYPHCWRCKKPLLFRATEQWFASIDGFRKEALEAIRNVRWIPSWGEDRIYNMVADRSDWCISRQRTWGVPIPIFYCGACDKEIITDETINHVRDLFKEHGSNIWFEKSAKELLPEDFSCPHCDNKEEFTKESDIMDVWFDSGSSHAAVCAIHPDLTYPADMYLEGSDQHRGWFNSSLSTSVAVNGIAPYKSVLTHGYVVDENGRKMSKSLGNVVSPIDVIKKMGADILRLWVSSADYRRDVAVSHGILKQMTEAYRKIRNTSRYLLANLYDFNPDTDKVEYEEFLEIDKWALLRLNKLTQRVTKAYDDYEFHVVYHAIHNFCVLDMSSFYLDVNKDRLYTLKADSKSRRAVQTVLYNILYTLVRLLTPILAYTSEEIWKYMPKGKDMPFSVQLTDWPEVNEAYLDPELEEKWDKILKIREEVDKALEQVRKEGVIGHPLDAKVDIYPENDEVYNILSTLEDLKTIFIVSEAVLHTTSEKAPEESFKEEDALVSVVVTHALGEKCERCWTYSTELGTDSEHPAICPKCTSVIKEL